MRARTRALHDRLDAAIGSAAIGDDSGYAAFLCVQHAARAPIERWASSNWDAPLPMPLTAPLIAADLVTLGVPLPSPERFAFPANADPLGLAWALGGSSLGNKALLAQRRRSGLTTADVFLSDGRLAAFFRSLLPQLDRMVCDHEADAAVAGAEAVFRTFLAATENTSLRTAE